ncbi:MAG: peptidoglycan DD-metalloendopeptidase family protein [Spirochaetes bacterium]|nr:peptidoglycan DD-metalloendopeptidase family protein [Spirochaetota bacterium]
MLRHLTIILLLININNNIFAETNKNKNYLIIGSNTAEKLYYSTDSNFSKNHDGLKAIDSDIKSSWISGNKGPHWIELNFESKRLMNKIIVYAGKKDNYSTLRNIILQFMYENTWFDFATHTFNIEKSWDFFGGSEESDKAVFDLGGLDASRFRIYIPEDGTYNGFAAIAEIEAYIGSNKIKCYDERLRGLFFPVINGLLPQDDTQYPNSPRKYRNGNHAGIDIYYHYIDDTYKPVQVDENTTVHAAEDGVVIRADWNYKPMTPAEWKNQSEYYQANPQTFVKRCFGGIQVWIDHGDGIVTTYNHLSKIDGDIKAGAKVERGQRIGWAGNSGLLGEAEGKKYGTHLHFEIWIDGYYLGKGPVTIT